MFVEGKNFLLRSAIFVGLGSVVTTIIYFTPAPDVEFASCERECRPTDWPMICRIKLTFEIYQTFSRSCGNCPRNSSDCLKKYCITADGYQRNVLSANRQVPGPMIQVCENDILLVDVVNRIPGQELAIHWRGQPQKETPVMDGVPMITQCPVPSYTTFQYRFRASASGTHLWHAHTGSQITDGLFGPLIVRQPDLKDPLKHLYDIDDKKYVIMINEWNHGSTSRRILDIEPSKRVTDTLLINGRGSSMIREGDVTPLTLFSVVQRKRYRLRMAYIGGKRGCLVSISVDSHNLKVIALDGNPIEPLMVSSVVLAPGERIDVVLETNQNIASYWIRAHTVEDCSDPTIQGSAVLQYSGADASSIQVLAPESDNLVGTEDQTDITFYSTVNQHCKSPNKNHDVCISDVYSSVNMPQDLSAVNVDTRLYLSYGYRAISSSGTFTLTSAGVFVPHLNNVTFVFPPFPLISQIDQLSPELLCNKDTVATRCHKADYEDVCECIHVIDIPLSNTVELVLVHQGEPDDGHVFHLHGHKFHVVGVTQLPERLALDKIKLLDSQGKLLLRNLVNPPLKDTIFIPNNGISVIRFKADNPGYWLLHDDRMSHWMNGINVILHVGESRDLPSLPNDFPTCGSWVGPELSLI